MLEELARPIEEYYASFQGGKARNFPSHLIKRMAEYLVRKYEEDLLAVYEGVIALMFEPEGLSKVNAIIDRFERMKEDFELFNSVLENNTTIGQYRDMVLENLAKLIDGLRKNEKRFYEEVLESNDQDFHITSYYSLYLKFLTELYVKLRDVRIDDPNVRTRDSKLKFTFNVANFVVALFGAPILVYIKRREHFPYLSEMAGLLLHALTTNRTPAPSPGSWGHYLFSMTVVTRNE